MRFAPGARNRAGSASHLRRRPRRSAPRSTRCSSGCIPSDYEQRVSVEQPHAGTPSTRASCGGRRTSSRAKSPKSFSLDLRDLSSEPWYAAAPAGRPARRGAERGVTARSRTRASITQAEDITFFDRERRRTISLTPRRSAIAARAAASFNEDDLRDYDVLDYNIEATVSPEREFIDGRARLRLRVRAPVMSTLTLRLADSLSVTGHRAASSTGGCCTFASATRTA